MIDTVTLSPALDKTIFVNDINLGGLNITDEVYEDAGGKGINVAKVLAHLGAEVTSISVLGGDVGKKIESLLNIKNIKQDNVYTQNNTRTNTKIVDNIKNQCTEINENSKAIDNGVIEVLSNKITYFLENNKDDKNNYLCLCGRLPKGLNDDFYGNYIGLANKNNVKTILDTSGIALKKAIEQKPWLIKPNIDELSEYFNKPLGSLDEIIEHCKIINNLGVEIVVVTLGEKGLICTTKSNTKDRVYKVTTPKVEVNSTVGAGDSFVGGFMYEYTKTQDLPKALVFGSATATAKVINKGTSVPNVSKIEKIKKDVVINEIKKNK